MLLLLVELVAAISTKELLFLEFLTSKFFYIFVFHLLLLFFSPSPSASRSLSSIVTQIMREWGRWKIRRNISYVSLIIFGWKKKSKDRWKMNEIVCTRTHTHAHAHMHTRTHTRTHAHTHARMHTSTYDTCIHIRTPTSTHTPAYKHTFSQTLTQ